MKKLCILLSIVCLCSFVLTSCTPNGNKDNEATDNGETEVSTLTQEEQQELEKKIKTVEETMRGLIKAETEEDLFQYVTELPAGYAKNILGKYPHDDYIITIEKKGEYKGYELFRIQFERESDADFLVSGIELFKMTDEGYLIETNEDIGLEVLETYACPNCNGRGNTVTVSGDCPVCGGTAMEYNEKAEYDKETKTWQGSYVDCSVCKGTGEANYTESICKTCNGDCLVF